MLPIANIIFWAAIFRIIGGMFTKPGTDENAVPRGLSIAVCFVVLAYPVYHELIDFLLWFYDVLLVAWHTYPEIITLIAYAYVFVIVRLKSTRPLLDAYDNEQGAIWKGIVRNLWILPALPFSSWWLGLLMLQPGIYYLAGVIWRRYPKHGYVWLAECVTGIVFGLCIPT